ncbi:MAG: UDP-N-acetylmuramoyl-tripeptide--D-alanyl-D-alanine ligase [Patescibacteria group bacterium]|nr:UDP-N-acetylmuramoyl-tripeptide--D-alanyl-D-alanine ligase [Patescibacteria group bacterium]
MKKFFKKIIEIFIGHFAKRIIKRSETLVVGVTGSVGKTSTKDAIHTVLSSKFNASKSWGNFNSELGLPLAVAGYKESDTSAGFWFGVLLRMFSLAYLHKEEVNDILVLEMGADFPGDIEKLVKIAPPDIGVVTNVSISHLEKFGRLTRIVSEKKKLPEAVHERGFSVLCGDDKKVMSMAKKVKSEIITFGLGKNNLIKATNIVFHWGGRGSNGKIEYGMNFKLNYNDKIVPVRIKNVLGIQQVYASLAAACCGIAVGMNLIEIAEALGRYEAPKGRLEVIKGRKGSVILDDTYNASPVSALAALDVLGEISAKVKVAVLADMLELGSKERKGHEEVGKMAGQVADVILTYGERSQFIAKSAAKAEKIKGNIVRHFETQEELVEYLDTLLKEKVVVLVKGSRGMHMERVVEAIMESPRSLSDKYN